MTRRTLLALPACAFAAERKNRVPVSHESLNVKVPQTPPIQLSNGLTLLAMEDKRLPLAWIGFQMDGAGPLYETRPALADFTVTMLTEGSKQRSQKQIAQDAARLGAEIATTADSGQDTATLNVSGLSSHFDEWLALTADVLLNPAFSVDEFNSLRERRSVNLQMAAARPDIVLADAMRRVIYGSHPAAGVPPTQADLDALTPDLAASWHRERYAPANTVLTVIGDVRASSVAASVEKLFGGWKTAAPKISLPPEPQPQPRRIVLIDRPGAAQTRLALGNLLFSRGNPDYDAGTIVNRIFGSGGNSRLERMELAGQALTARSGINANRRYPGYWDARITVRTEGTAAALASIIGELRRLCEEPVSPQELEEAKTAAIGRFALTLERPPQVINYSYTRWRFGFSADYWERSPARISALTAAEIQAVAQKYYQPDRAHIVAVGDAAKIRSALEKFGKVESRS